jgi:hypothetical protein
VQTLTIASRNFITSQDLSSVGEILGVSALDKCGAWMLGLSPGCQDLLDQRHGVCEIGNHHDWACAVT